MCGESPSDGGAAKREKERQARIQSGIYGINTTFQPFNDEFFAGRSKAYVDYATPQLKGQYQDAYRNLVTALHRSGIMQSSEAARRMGKLQKQYSLAQQGVADTGFSVANSARKDIENSRSALINDLQVTADPSSALAAAQARQAVFAANPQFQPLTNLFTDVTAGLADYNESRNNALLRSQIISAIKPVTGSSSDSVLPSRG